MPRNSSGTYSLPSGNPVQSGTLIDATWANNTLNDLANEMTDSLSRTGEGGMLAPFRLADGVQATPGLAFTNEPSTGLYRAGTNEMWAVVGGAQQLQFTNTGLLVPASRTVTFNNSAIACPNNLSFDSDTFYIDATNDRIGIGTSTPYATLTVVSAGTNNTRGIAGEHYDNTTAFSQFKFVGSRARGNRGNPSAVLADDSLASYNGRGYKANAWSDTVGGFYIYAAENWTNSTTGTYMTWRGVASGGTTVSEWMRINATGVGIGTTTPGDKLEVNGRVAAKSSSDVNLAFVLNNTASGGREWQFIASSTGGLDGGGTFNLRDNTAGANRLTVSSGGNLGLGVTPSAWESGTQSISVGAGTALWNPGSGTVTRLITNAYRPTAGDYTYRNNGGSTYYEQSGSTHAWYNAGTGTAGNNITFTQAMTLDASGNLGIGTASPSDKLSVFTSGANLASFTRDLATDVTLSISADNDGTIFATGGVHNMRFFTNSAERARITAGGDFGIGSTSPGARLDVFHDGAAVAGQRIRNTDTGSASQNAVVFERNTTVVGTITTTNTATAYNQSSDRRLKENIAPSDDAGPVIDGIEIVKHDWKVGGHTRYGVIAQDLYEVAPEAVTAGDDGEEVEKVWGVDYSKLVPMLVKEIQSLRARVAALEAA